MVRVLLLERLLDDLVGPVDQEACLLDRSLLSGLHQRVKLGRGYGAELEVFAVEKIALGVFGIDQSEAIIRRLELDQSEADITCSLRTPEGCQKPSWPSLPTLRCSDQ